MGMQYRPEVGDWYQTGSDDLFEVVALDPDDRTIEIQYFDGSIEELDMETWLELELMMAEPPEDYSGSLDLAIEDLSSENEQTQRMAMARHLMDGFDRDR